MERQKTLFDLKRITIKKDKIGWRVWRWFMRKRYRYSVAEIWLMEYVMGKDEVWEGYYDKVNNRICQ